jgi:riboflavin kinase/FMN adenylyltransferase
VVNIGRNPTFGGTERTVEVHILDQELDLLGKRLTVEFLARLRSERKFSNVEALKGQIARDCEQARRLA